MRIGNSPTQLYTNLAEVDLQVEEESTRRSHQTQGLVSSEGLFKEKGIDYEEVYAPVVRFETTGILIALVALKGWQIHHLDVKSAFLNGEINEVIHVKQPEGFLVKEKEGHALRLKKALYGLKQAPRAWYFKLHSCLISLGFIKSNHE